jgi:hypothetical protein
LKQLKSDLNTSAFCFKAPEPITLPNTMLINVTDSLDMNLPIAHMDEEITGAAIPA